MPNSGFEGNKGTAGLSKEDYLKLRPMMIETNSIIKQLEVRAGGDTELAFKTLQEVNAVLRQKYGLQVRLQNRIQDQKLPAG